MIEAVKFSLPNVYQTESRDIADRLYGLAIPRVLWSGYPAEALRLLRLVRRYAREAKVRHAGWILFSFEFDALLRLGRTEEAWRLVRRHLRTFSPRRWRWPVERRIRYMDHFVSFYGGLAQLLQIHLEQLLLDVGLDVCTALRRQLALRESVGPLVQLHGSCAPGTCTKKLLSIGCQRGVRYLNRPDEGLLKLRWRNLSEP